MSRVRLPARLSVSLAFEDDQALLARFTEQRDEQAFAAIVARHSRMVYGVCKRLLRDEHLAEDAFQAVLLVLAKHPERIATASSVGGWLFGIARRVSLAARRHEERRFRREHAHQQPDGCRSPAAGFDDLLQVLDEELARLPEAERAALIACFLEERTQDEAARQLGWSLSTLRRRLERGKELLRNRLTRRGATLAGGLLAGIVAPSATAAVPAHLLKLGAEPSPLAKVLAAEIVRSATTLKFGFLLTTLVALGGLGFAMANVEQERPEQARRERERTEKRDMTAPAPRDGNRTPWVSISGRVIFPKERDFPKPRFVANESIKDLDFFGGATIDEVLIDPKTRGIANAVVWLRPDSDDRKTPFPAKRIHPQLAAVGPRNHRLLAGSHGFSPRVIAARAGDQLIFENPAPIPFNVNYHPGGAFPGADEELGEFYFNLILPKDGSHTTAKLPARWSQDIYRDNIHPWIHGTVWVFDHPYFAVTDANGNFTIPNAPAGTWRLMIWHEKAGHRNRLGERITIAADGKLELGSLVHASPGWDDR
jgi:RNA polymerase sigma factor (sigma-70 family)